MSEQSLTPLAHNHNPQEHLAANLAHHFQELAERSSHYEHLLVAAQHEILAFCEHQG